ncbi:MAG: nitroreductase family protein [Candidatus Nezhaarchaeales archaeon]|nr:MAG: nitroreductase family protein [Candidatus Nezhaarchaeota archaeon WYZ-LMO8]TDA37250.1 MAG: nitroreductase family protein [Candidatus Nezhaarchaeota archaeon WYZ-LMO7]
MKDIELSSIADVLANVIKTRRTIRRFKKDVKVPKEVIERILDIARWSPSGSNAQEWRFIAIMDERLLRAMKMFSPGWLGEAPAAIVACADKDWSYRVAGVLGRDKMYLIDVGIVVQTIALLAHAMGLGTNIIMSFSQEAISELLNVPHNWEIVVIIAIGYPDEEPKPPPRMSLSELVIWR